MVCVINAATTHGNFKAIASVPVYKLVSNVLAAFANLVLQRLVIFPVTVGGMGIGACGCGMGNAGS